MVIAQLSMPLLEWATGGETLPEKIVEEETETAMDVNQMLDNADRIVDKYMDNEVKSRLNKYFGGFKAKNRQKEAKWQD